MEGRFVNSTGVIGVIEGDTREKKRGMEVGGPIGKKGKLRTKGEKEYR